jgi:hypothetical protein
VSTPRHRLHVRRLESVGFVDAPDNPLAQVAFHKRREENMSPFDKLTREDRAARDLSHLSPLQQALAELEQLISSAMRANHDRRAVAAMVLAQHPELHRRIEALASEEGTPVTKVRVGEKHALRQVLEDEVEAEARKLVASGTETDIAKARARAWQADQERLNVYHWPGAEQIGKAAITSARTRRAADEAIEHVAKIMAPGDYVLGHRLACANFPALAAAARGAPRVVR